MSQRHTQNGSSREGDRFPEELLTAYALGQIEATERGEIERMLANPAQDEARQIVAETQRLAAEVPPALAAADGPCEQSPALREAVIASLNRPTIEIAGRSRWLGLTWIEWTVVGGIACALAGLWFPGVQMARDASQQVANSPEEIRKEIPATQSAGSTSAATTGHTTVQVPEFAFSADPQATTLTAPGEAAPAAEGQKWFDQEIRTQTERLSATVADDVNSAPIRVELQEFGEEAAPKASLMATVGAYQGSGVSGRGASVRQPHLQAYGGNVAMEARGRTTFQGQLAGQPDYSTRSDRDFLEKERDAYIAMGESARPQITKRNPELREAVGGEQYEAIHENTFLAPRQHPLSTFSIDVDTASYANMRRFLTGGRLPPPNAVRIEELVNYFRFDYPQPKGPEPFSVNLEVAECPWVNSHLLLRVGLKGKEVHQGERPASNLVFLLDVSGSMADENKLPLLKTAMQMLVKELGENDRVSIVTYAGEAGLRLPPTRGHEQTKILAAIESLSSGGSTNGSAGIDLAYEQAKAYFVEGGTNRVILCTDGDLNVGITDDDALVQLIKQKAAGGTFLTVLGFGEGNLKDAKMEKLADNGNGLYAYIDSVREARKVLVEQMTGSTITIAKDVKIQIEFNPAVIASYRLLGYENRVLAAQDFNDDKKDAGEIGAGHTVTALYELVPVGAKPEAAVPAGVEPLKYQAAGEKELGTGDRGQGTEAKLTEAAKSGELLTLKLRYKEPEGQASKLMEFPLKDRGGKFNGASKDLQFAAAVASFGMILRGSEHKGSSNIAAVEEIASGAIGEDASGYRAEFVDLVRKAQTIGAR